MLRAWTAAPSDIPSWGDPATGRPRTEARSGNVIASPANAIDAVGTVVPGLRPVLVKGIQAALTRRSDPPLTKLAPLSPRGKGADDPHPVFRKGVESGPSQKPWSAAR